MTAFRKRTFDLPLLVASSTAALTHLPVLIGARRRPRLPAALREQIMLAVTRVNDCRYCSWVHTGLALQQGVDLDALNRQLGERLEACSEREVVAILFAQHYAERQRRPEPAALAALRRHYRPAERREIMAYIHEIYFANLTGNSADAVLARLRGQSVEGSLPVQLLAALIGAPVLARIWLESRRGPRAAMAAL